MADHGDNYKRMTGPAGEQIGALGPECGHHCGIITTGSHSHVGHCACRECHDNPPPLPPINELPASFTNETIALDPRGIS